MPRMSGLCLLERREVLLDRVVDAEIDDLEAGALEHHRDQVLADVVNVALDRADDDLADRLGTPVSASSGRRISMPPFIEFAASSTSGTNRMPSRKSMPTMRMPSTRASFSTFSAFQPRSRKMSRGLFDLGLQSVVQVIVHLLDELLLVEVA